MRLFAPAKVNLTLHVTGKRVDGYHLLDSLVVFVDAGDWLRLDPADTLSLRVEGPRALGVPDDKSNLIWQAAESFGLPRGAVMTLEKHLPHAGGIGGGSADAAAALRGLSRLWDVPLPSPETRLALGADVPVCVHAKPCRMSGIGETLSEVPALPPFWLVLANAGVEVPTGPVFQTLQTAENAPMTPLDWTDATGFVSWLQRNRNDLEPPARDVAPVIGDVLEHLQLLPGCLLSRMSGSGGTCFGVFADQASAENAARLLAARQPDWWITPARIRGPADSV